MLVSDFSKGVNSFLYNFGITFLVTFLLLENTLIIVFSVHLFTVVSQRPTSAVVKLLKPNIAYKDVTERRIDFVHTKFTYFYGGSSRIGWQIFLLAGYPWFQESDWTVSSMFHVLLLRCSFSDYIFFISCWPAYFIRPEPENELLVFSTDSITSSFPL